MGLTYRRLPVALRWGVLATLIVVGAWATILLTGVGGDGVSKLVSNVGLVLSALVGATGCFVTARRAESRYRRFWILLGAGCLSWGLGQVVWTIYESVLHLEAFPSPSDIGYLGMPVLVGAALMSVAHAPVGTIARVRAVLDGVMIAAALFVVSWIAVLGDIVRAGGETPFATAITIAYPAADIVLVTIALYVAARIRVRGGRLPLWLPIVVLGVLSLAVADSGFAYLTLTESYASGSVVDLGWFCGFLCMMLASLTRSGRTDDETSPDDAHRPLGQLVAQAPVVLALAATVITAGDGVDRVVAATWGILLAAIITRHALVLRENIALAANLEARVAARTAEIDASARRFQALVQHGSEVVTVVDDQGIVSYQSDSIARMLGREPDSFVGRPALNLTTPATRRDLAALLEAATASPGVPRRAECDFIDTNSTERRVEVTATSLLDDPDVRGVVLNTRDISRAKALEQRLVHAALHDGLTGLPNRSLFSDRLSSALFRVGSDRTVAVLFVDLDGFKRVNDTIGHAAGDEMLIEIAQRIQGTLRPGDTVARFGGDEFAILLNGVASEADAIDVAARIRERLSTGIRAFGHEVFARASVGVAIASADDTAETLLRAADLAMYQAKDDGGGGYAVYHDGLHSSLLERVELERDLRAALRRGEIAVQYQPTFNLDDGRLTGFEALARWHHAERGSIPPNRFIPVAEEAGLVREVGRVVLRAACERGAQWMRAGAGRLTMAVNLSAAELRDPDFVDEVTACLRETGFPAGCLVVEMTEGMLISDSIENLSVLRRLVDLGIRLAIDDFGTGYSSLSYLRLFPVAILKIDRTFVDGLGQVAADTEFVRTIVELGRSLSLTTIAEGVEDHDQLAALRDTGCDLAQGFLFSRPLDADAAEALVVQTAGADLTATTTSPPRPAQASTAVVDNPMG